ncbi:TVP38/TMEM64 family protein [Nocardioides donggukensis]|uniref:TVP38/TMEM64 family membrane protein n=1 Tax=Nocardioides donggukensis TaxID=2774019 RepID=A0A927K209_9ACTN|nr:TVP38/TMEM64 family protein [Nocardioides donggukensis]MBD8868252.1 TVP38/TMEM64 family protein [Nocardioides donggukensis]
MKRGLALRVTVLLALVVTAVLVQVLVGLPSQDEVRSTLDGLGAWAVPAFVAVYVLVCLLPAGPTAVVTIVGGALLGFAVGLPAVLTGAVLGATVAFSVSRLLGRDAVRRISGARVQALDEKVREHGFATVLVARLVPLVPFSTANFAFGLTSVTGRAYVTATAVGIVPGTVVYVSVGAFGSEPGSWPFLLAVAGLVLLSVVGAVRARRSRSDDGSTAAPVGDAGVSATPRPDGDVAGHR